MFEYVCPDCKQNEISVSVIPKNKCSNCKKLYDVVEWEGNEETE